VPSYVNALNKLEYWKKGRAKSSETTWGILYILRTMMTINGKDPGRACGKKEVKTGELINAKLDVVLANDITAPFRSGVRAAGQQRCSIPTGSR